MQFAQPVFLWGLLGISIPVLIHLLQLRRPQRVRFTNTSFIQEIEFKTGRRRLQDLLVLLARVLGILFLVLAFCQPTLTTQDSKSLNVHGEIAVFADNSASMLVPGQTQRTLLDESAAVASAISKDYGADTRLRLLGHGSRETTENAYQDKITALATETRLGWGSAIVSQTLLSSQHNPLYIISDFQKAETKSVLLRQLPTGREIVLLPQASQPVGNIYVDSVWLNDAFVRMNISLSLHVRLRNGGELAVRNCAVKVLLAGKQVASFEASIAAGQLSETAVAVQLTNDKAIAGKVVLEDNPVVFDNTFNFTLQPAAAVRVVELGEAPVAQAAYRSEPLFSYSFARPGQVRYSDLQQANLVLLNELVVLPEGLRSALSSVVRRGGSVVVVPSAATPGRAALQQVLQAVGAGNVAWETTSGASGVVRQELAVPVAGTTFFKDVFGTQPRQVAMPEVSSVLRATRGGTDILRLRDGGGFLTEFAAGTGRVYVFAAPFNKEYSNFTTHALFIPVLYRLAMLSYRNDQPLAYRIGDAAIAVRPAGNKLLPSEAAAYRLVGQGQAFVLAPHLQGQQVRLDIPAELTKPGIYELRRQGQLVATLAFNEAKQESELVAYSVAELRQLAGNKPNVHVLDASEQLAALRQYRAAQAGRPLWRYCLVAVLLCLLAEVTLLRWGRQLTTPQVQVK